MLNNQLYQERIRKVEEQLHVKDQQIAMLINRIPPHPVFISLTEAGLMLKKHRGTVGKMAGRGELIDNGCQGSERKISKLSVYEYRDKKNKQQKIDDYDDWMDDYENAS